jgi:hypothetical protein
MKYTTFNIGLHNNPLNYESMARFMNNAFGTTNESVEIQLRDGEYNSDTEPTAVVRIWHNSEYQDALWAEMMAATLCTLCTQECIPYIHYKDGFAIDEQLVYNLSFQGDKYDFDAAYFIEYSDKD